MAENSEISWTDHTHNEWIGCEQISDACDFCYAKSLVENRLQRDFGERWLTSESNRKKPYTWNRAHAKFFAEHGRRQRVFCSSLADVFDNQVPAEWRLGLFETIAKTPNLDWMLLTKRPQNIAKMMPRLDFANVWLGTTVENQEEANRRIPHLLAAPARVRFLSCEPLLGDIQLHTIPAGDGRYFDLTYHSGPGLFDRQGRRLQDARLDWIIAGGENAGKKSRPTHPAWFRSLRDQSTRAGIAFHFKQWGAWCEYGHPGMPGSRDHGRDVIGLGARTTMVRAGVKAAGRVLDGRTWDEFPKVAA